MSKYEWERGTIKIPAKAWASFRTEVIKAWNEQAIRRLERATKLHARAKEVVKGKRGAKRQEALRQLQDQHLRSHPEDDATIGMVMSFRWENGKSLLELKNAPKKKDAQILPTTKDCTLSLGDATVTLRNEARTVTWDVPENNHARDHARRHPVAKALFRLLDRIDWTRGSGGKIVGNDEYNRDSEYEGGGGSYVTVEYSPEAQKRRASARSSYSGYGSFGRNW
jgi:hypothetical protein